MDNIKEQVSQIYTTKDLEVLSIVLKGDGAQAPVDELDQAKAEGNQSSNADTAVK